MRQTGLIKQHNKHPNVHVRAATTWGFIEPSKPPLVSSGKIRQILRDCVEFAAWLAALYVSWIVYMVAL